MPNPNIKAPTTPIIQVNTKPQSGFLLLTFLG